MSAVIGLMQTASEQQPLLVRINPMKRMSSPLTSRLRNRVDITTQPQTTYYSGEKLNLSGMVVMLVYNTDETAETTSYTTSPANGATLAASDTMLTITYAEGDVSLSTFINLTVNEITVSSIEIIDTRTQFYIGDLLADQEIKVKVNYNKADEKPDILIGGYDITPSTPLKATDTSYTVTYDGKSATKAISVVAKPTGYSYKLSGTPTKKSYNVGDKFNADGLSLQIAKDDVNLGNPITGSALTDLINYTFTESDVGQSTFTFKFYYNIESVELSLSFTVSNLTVKMGKTSIEIRDITDVQLKKDSYPVGYTISVSDIESISGTGYIGGSNTRQSFKIKNADFDSYNWDLDIEVLAIYTDRNDRTSTERKSKNYRHIIEENDVFTRNNRKYVYMSLRVDDDALLEFEISVGDSGVYVYYTYGSSTTLAASFDDVMDALDAVNDEDIDFISNYRSSGTFTVKLGEDQVVSRGFTIEPIRNLTLDLNGYSLRFYERTVQFGRSNRYTFTVTNTASSEGKLTYYDTNYDALKIDKNEKITFQYDTSSDLLPGIYTVKIADVKNGTITSKPEADKNGNVTVSHGNDIVFTITPAQNFEIASLRDGTNSITDANVNYTVNKYTGVITYIKRDVQADATVAFTFQQKSLRGDIDESGNVDSNDAIYLLRHTMNEARYPIRQSGDMDGDKFVNSDDAIYLLRHAMNPERYPLYETTSETSETGFTEEPTVKSPGIISFMANLNGDLYYYYSADENAPSSDRFHIEYNAARYNSNGAVLIKKNFADEFMYDTSLTERYPYLVIAIRDLTGEFLTPVILNIDVKTEITQGFTVNPYVKDGRVYFKTSDDGEVFYYYTTSSSAVSADDFYDEFYDTSSDYRYTMDVTGNRETARHPSRSTPVHRSATTTLSSPSVRRMRRHAMNSRIPTSSISTRASLTPPWVRASRRTSTDPTRSLKSPLPMTASSTTT